MLYLMKCGHIALGTKDGKPVCPICYGINWSIQQIDNKIYNVEGIEYNCFSIIYTKLK